MRGGALSQKVLAKAGAFLLVGGEGPEHGAEGGREGEREGEKEGGRERGREGGSRVGQQMLNRESD